MPKSKNKFKLRGPLSSEHLPESLLFNSMQCNRNVSPFIQEVHRPFQELHIDLKMARLSKDETAMKNYLKSRDVNLQEELAAFQGKVSNFQNQVADFESSSGQLIQNKIIGQAKVIAQKKGDIPDLSKPMPTH